jgi:5-formyltetrahydrofolate cyclo-ligase
VPRRHDHDATGDPDTLADKAALRNEVWGAVRRSGAMRFPGPDNRIPNFVGAEAAAELLRASDAWQAAQTVKANPDSPQLPVRQRALQDGKLLFMAVPRLADDKAFFLLDPERLDVKPRQAASIKGASTHGHPVGVDELEPVDLVVTGCVAVDETGARLGKGGGFSDLEYALASEAGLIGDRTVVVTTVHEVQVVDTDRIPMLAHDFRLDLIVTPERVIRCHHPRGGKGRPGVRWDELSDEKIASIPLLGRLRSAAATQAPPRGTKDA